jgi:hypothetical protein
MASKGAGFPRGARVFFTASKIAAALAAGLIAALALGGCARRQPPPAAPVYPYKADAAKAFFATLSGLSDMTYQGEAAEELPASRAPNASVMSADGAAIAVAVNGWGLERIEASPDGGAYRLVDCPLPSAFGGLATGGAWPLGGGFLVQLYRDPFGASVEEAGAAPAKAPESASRLVFFGGGEAAATIPDPFPPGGDPGFELFALLPAGNTWFAELRKDGAERVDLKFFALEDPRAGKEARQASIRPIRRSEFEAALSPLSLALLRGEAGDALRSALARLGPGPWLVRLRSGRGEDRWYLSSGKAEDASKAFGWILARGRAAEGAGEGAGVLALSQDGRLASSDGRGGSSLERLVAPAEGASFTALAAAGTIAAAAWEAGEFPYLSSAGVIIVPIR